MTLELIISQPQPQITGNPECDNIQQVEITCYSQLLEIVDNQCNVPWIQANIQFLNTIKGEKGDPGSGSTKKIEFTTTDWVSIAGGYELSLVHGLESEVHTEIYSSGAEVLCDKIPFNTNTIKLRVPIDYRFEGYAIIKN